MRITKFIVVTLLFFSLSQVANSQELTNKVITKSMLKAFKWQEKNPKHDPRDWTNGAYYIGVTKAYESTQNKAFLKGLIKMTDSTKWKPFKRWYHADDIAICQSYLYMKDWGVNGANLEPTKAYLDKMMTEKYDWNNEPDKPIILWWCDALFMGPPTFVHYGMQTGDMKYLEASDRLYKECYDLLFDQEENLFARDMNYQWKGDKDYLKEANGQKIFWSRGNGWVMGGLALLLTKMPQDYANRPFYVELYKKMAARLKEIQPEDGMFRSSLLDPDSYPHGEVSGTGFYTYAILWGVNNGLLDKDEYMPMVTKAMKGLIACQKSDGMMGWVQPIGADPKRNFSADSWEVYGTGAYLLACSEWLKLK